jgi:hypothetical protein
MPRTTLPWLILACVAVSAALAWWTLARSMRAEAPQRVEHRDLAPFHEIEVGGRAAITLVQADRESLDIDTPAHGARIETKIDNGRLVVRSQDARRWWRGLFGRRPTGTPNITVRFRKLDAIALTGNVRMNVPVLQAASMRILASGGSDLSIDDLHATSLHLVGSGALKARLAGRVDDEHVAISGAGSYRAEHLIAEDATVSVSGVGDVLVHATRTLNARISGAGVIEYVGDPRVTERVSGIGRVRRREPEKGPGVTATVAPGQCIGTSGSSVSSLKNSGPRVSGSMSGWMPGAKRTSDTRQSRTSASSIDAASCTDSYG